MELIYNSSFFNEFYEDNGGGNYTDKGKWIPFFNSVADEIVKRYNPKTVLDAGCALGYIVEALRDRGVEAYGFDISDYAIESVRADIKPYCIVHSVTEPLPETFPQKFDVVITLEVLEHLFPEDAEKAVANLCNYTDMIIFSSTATDIQDRSHVNVRLPEYWSKVFAQNHFFRELEQDMRFISPWAKLYAKKSDISKVVFNYEMNMRIDSLCKNSGVVKLYYNDGGGYSETQTIISEKTELEHLDYEFVLPENLITLRLDIPGNSFFIVRDMKLYTDKGALYPTGHNGVAVGEYHLFNHYNPQYYFDFENKGISRIKVQAGVYPAKNMEIAELIHETITQLRRKEAAEAECQRQEQEKIAYAQTCKESILLCEQKYTALQAECQRQEQEKIAYAQTCKESILLCEQKYTALQTEFDTLQQYYQDMKEKNEQLMQQNGQLNTMYETVMNAACWKITKPVRMVLDSTKSLLRELTSARQLKKTVKIFAPEKVCGKLVEPFKPEQRYNIDTFTYAYNILELTGWFFVKHKKVQSLQLKLIINDKSYFIDMIYGMQRTDVADIFGIEYTNTGFKAKVKIEHCIKADVYLVYEDVEGSKGDFFLREIQATDRAETSFEQTPMIENILSGEGNRISLAKWMEANIGEQFIPDKKIYEEMVDLIVPVYNGYDFLDSLFSSIAQTKMRFRLIIVNDKSPDERVTSYLRKYAEVHEYVILLENEENLGFVKSVNRGLEHCKNHVVLVNTDIEVPPMWLERLMTPIILKKNVATSTPFTNSGTICSFPEMGKDNEIFLGMSVAEIDTEFSKINPSYFELPTGVGFCMGMNKDALKKIGKLDEVTFGKGYGEENDWCQRAIKAGYTNVLVDNLFVYHKHGGSFLSEEKARLIEQNTAELLKKHPDYMQQVARYCGIDPAEAIREYVKTRLLLKQYGEPAVFLNHNLGGGAASYIKQQKDIFASGPVFVISYDSEFMQYYLDLYCSSFEIGYRLQSLEEIESIFAWTGIRTIYINELVTYPKLYQLLECIQMWKKQYHAELVMFIHDYYPVCPSLNLLNNQGIYCEIPKIEQCRKCLIDNQYLANRDYKTILEWRKKWGIFLQNCDEIRCFSNDSARILRKAYGELSTMTVIPHKVEYMISVNKQFKTTDKLTIGILGTLTYHKGLHIIKEMLTQIEANKDSVQIVLIGTVQEPILSSYFRCTGKYTPAELPTLMFREDIDILFISSICPETFSYTAEEAMQLNMPVACFNIGAPADRIKKYEKGLIIENQDAAAALSTIKNWYRQNMNQLLAMVSSQKVLFIAESFSFATRYRVEHFREQLLILGQTSDLILLNELKQVQLEKYAVIVIYRCKKDAVLEKLVKAAQQKQIPVLYDIDDYVFDYDAISYLDFLKDDEYADFRKTTESIQDMMALCNGFLTSTETLRRKIQTHFPGKRVFVNRNVASLEMVAWSKKATASVNRDRNRVILGYFSGSGTHNKDFSKIEDIIIRLMKKYPYVYLKTGGVLNVNPKFTPFKNRMIHFDFMDWRNLPEQIASVDINLMPLEDTEFHACKSENKWTEAGLVGVPTIATLNEELAMVIKDGENGMLAANETEWEEKLDCLISDKTLRERIGDNARQKVYENHLTQNTGADALEFLYKIISQK